jgi:hypothetical protein
MERRTSPTPTPGECSRTVGSRPLVRRLRSGRGPKCSSGWAAVDAEEIRTPTAPRGHATIQAQTAGHPSPRRALLRRDPDIRRCGQDPRWSSGVERRATIPMAFITGLTARRTTRLPTPGAHCPRRQSASAVSTLRFLPVVKWSSGVVTANATTGPATMGHGTTRSRTPGRYCQPQRWPHAKASRPSGPEKA